MKYSSCYLGQPRIAKLEFDSLLRSIRDYSNKTNKDRGKNARKEKKPLTSRIKQNKIYILVLIDLSLIY